MSSLLAKLKKNSRIDSSSTLDESKFFNQGDNSVPTDVPMINVALSGDLDKGLTSGLTVLAGPSKHFKTSFALIMVAAYMRKYPESIVLFYDSEFGSPQAYFKTFGIDTSRVLHCPIMNVEDLKFDIMKQLDGIEKGEKVIIMIDSVGNLASKKEVEDAMNEKSVADMTRAKAFKSLFRMVTPHLSMKDIPIVAIGHTYKTQDMYPKDVLSGGCLVAGTQILMLDGKKKNIEDIITGEIVETLAGPKLVTATWNPDTLENGEPECYEITFSDGTKVECSENHKFLIEDQWVEAQNLSVNQKVKRL